MLSLYLTHPKILLTRNNNIFRAYTSVSDTCYAYADLEDAGYTSVGSNAVRTNTMWLLRLMLHYIIKKGNVDGKKKDQETSAQYTMPCYPTRTANSFCHPKTDRKNVPCSSHGPHITVSTAHEDSIYGLLIRPRAYLALIYIKRGSGGECFSLPWVKLTVAVGFNKEWWHHPDNDMPACEVCFRLCVACSE